MKMTKQNVIIGGTLLSILAFGAGMFAQEPARDIDPHRHGNLASAQGYIVDAWQKINKAQQANEDQLGGHAQRAKELLLQADEELRLAANVANENRR
jgi:hypothetical protein